MPQSYITTQLCSTGLTIGCYVSAGNGYYSNGIYSYYIQDNTVTNVIYDPCAPPPPPPPPGPVWTAIVLASGTGGGGGTACQTSPNSTYYMNGDIFINSTQLVANSDGTGAIPATYYSDGEKVRYWDGSSLGTVVNCYIA